MIRVFSAEKDLGIYPRTLPPECDPGPMDYNYAQQLLEQYDREGRYNRNPVIGGPVVSGHSVSASTSRRVAYTWVSTSDG